VHVALLSSRRGFYGGEVHLRDLALGLRARGHRVTCLVRPRSALARALHREDLAVRPLRLGSVLDPLSVGQLARTLRQLRPDVLHSHCPPDYFLAAVASLGSPVCNIGTRHQLYPISWLRVKRPLLDRFAAVIAVSEAVRDGLLACGMPPRQVVTVLNGIPPREPAVPPASLRRELGLPANTGPVIGQVGRLSGEKEPDLVLQAAARLRGRWPGLQVVFVGDDGGDRQSADRLRELGRRHRLAVRICGYRPDAARLMPAFDVLAVTSRAEPFGLVTAEALARGVPVVATRSGGSREIIRDGREGLLVAPGDPRALARAISRLLAEHDLRARCTAAGPRRVAACFTHARQLADTEQVYRLALAGSPLPRTMAPVADWCPGREE
jgi:glycosyltransferase involved in cell wall biosynthesis